MRSVPFFQPVSLVSRLAATDSISRFFALLNLVIGPTISIAPLATDSEGSGTSSSGTKS